MRTKKVLAMLVALVMMMSLAIIPASADAAFTITAQNATVKLGENVTVKIDADFAASGGLGFEITYAAEDLTFVSGAPSTNHTLFEAGDLLLEEVEAGKLSVTVLADMMKPFSGTILDLVFKAKDSMDVAKTTSEIGFAFVAESTLDGDYNPVAEDGISFVKGEVSIVKTHEAPVVTAAIAGEAIVGKTLTASATFTDNWDITEGTKTYAWFIDGAEVATGETYVVKAADYGKAITAKATVVVEADENTTGVGEATTAAVAYDATAKSAATVAIKSTVIAVGAPIELETTTTKSINDGEVALTYAWTYEDGTALAGEPVNEATYTPVLADYQAGKKIKVTVTPKGANDAIDGDAVSATTTTETVAGNMQPVIADLKVMDGETELVAPVVGDVLTVAYAWSDVAEVGGPAEADTDASVVTWYVGDAEGIEAAEYEVKAEDIGKAIKVTVDAVSTDATPNTNLDLDATEVVKGNTLEATTAAVAKNTEYKPAVENVAFSAKKITMGKNVKVVYDYEDLNAIADASTFVIEVADAEDATEWTKVFEGTAADVNATNYKFTKAELNKYARIAVTVKNAEGDEPTENKVVYSEPAKVNKASSGSAGLTGPNLSSGSPSVPGTETPGTDAPVVNKDALILTINSKAVSVFGEAVENDVAPIIKNDRTMLPARIVAESLGAEVAWDETSKTVTITKGETVIVIVIDSDKATVNGEEVALDSAAFIENDRTYTPIRFIAEALGAEVAWDDATKTVTITPAK